MDDKAAPIDDKAAVSLPPSVRTFIVALTMISVLMVTLDMTIANVALPHMQAALGANPESVSWVLTSYILASAVMTLMTGWLGGRLGRKQLFVLALGGFTASSALCGVAGTLPLMVGARFLQGMFGAFVLPLSQALILDMYPRRDHMRAITVWGLGAMVGPIAGPVLGGYLTDALNWRWVFMINVPIGIVATVGLMALMPALQSIRRPFDKIGFLLLAGCLIPLQLALDRGTPQGWLESTEILVELGICLSCGWALVFHLRNADHPIIPMAIFRDRNCVAALVFAFFMGGVNVAGGALLAPMTQTLLGYPVLTAGILMLPRSLSMAAAMLLTGRLVKILDVRLVIAGGILLTAWSSWITAGFNLQMGPHLLIVSGLVLGAGLGLSFTPMNVLLGSTLAPELRTDAAALYTLLRSIGSSIVISASTAFLARNLQINHEELGAHITAQSTPILQPGLLEAWGVQGQSLAAMLDAEINRQALMIAYLDDFWLLTVCALCTLPVVFVLRPMKIDKDVLIHPE